MADLPELSRADAVGRKRTRRESDHLKHEQVNEMYHDSFADDRNDIDDNEDSDDSNDNSGGVSLNGHRTSKDFETTDSGRNVSTSLQTGLDGDNGHPSGYQVRDLFSAAVPSSESFHHAVEEGSVLLITAIPAHKLVANTSSTTMRSIQKPLCLVFAGAAGESAKLLLPPAWTEINQDMPLRYTSPDSSNAVCLVLYQNADAAARAILLIPKEYERHIVTASMALAIQLKTQSDQPPISFWHTAESKEVMSEMSSIYDKYVSKVHKAPRPKTASEQKKASLDMLAIQRRIFRSQTLTNEQLKLLSEHLEATDRGFTMEHVTPCGDRLADEVKSMAGGTVHMAKLVHSVSSKNSYAARRQYLEDRYLQIQLQGKAATSASRGLNAQSGAERSHISLEEVLPTNLRKKVAELVENQHASTVENALRHVARGNKWPRQAWFVLSAYGISLDPCRNTIGQVNSSLIKAPLPTRRKFRKNLDGGPEQSGANLEPVPPRSVQTALAQEDALEQDDAVERRTTTAQIGPSRPKAPLRTRRKFRRNGAGGPEQSGANLEPLPTRRRYSDFYGGPEQSGANSEPVVPRGVQRPITQEGAVEQEGAIEKDKAVEPEGAVEQERVVQHEKTVGQEDLGSALSKQSVSRPFVRNIAHRCKSNISAEPAHVSLKPSDRHEGPTMGPRSHFYQLTPEEQALQTRYFRITEGQVRCVSCGNRGHMPESCPDRNCEHCGAVDEHSPAGCPTYRKCSRCRQRGHDGRSCTNITVLAGGSKDPCDVCGETGHVEEECSYLWRVKIDPTTIAKVPRHKIYVACHNCGSGRHWGDDCPHHSREFRTAYRGTWSKAHADQYILPSEVIDIDDDGKPEVITIGDDDKPEVITIDDDEKEPHVGTKRSWQMAMFDDGRDF